MVFLVYDKKQAALFILLPLLLFLLLAPTKDKISSIDIPYETGEIFTLKEPYQELEAYESNEPYQDKGFFTDIIPLEGSVRYFDQKNTTYDARTGEFFEACRDNCTCSKVLQDRCIQCACIELTEKYRHDIVYEKIEKERPVLKYRPVTRYRPVLKFKEVNATRKVVRLRAENRTSQANWLFGYPVPWRLQI
ncbi:MAG TPA: hypothetical protein VFF28_06755 [Candidatus Nanoarchaeia archaeon]|nr:hypothetical protein [Candidatus Nanoarchaeia archaeon]